MRLRGDQEAQAQRRGEEALLGGALLLGALFGEARRFRRIDEVFVLIGVGALLGWGAGRDQEAGEVPGRRPDPARQALLGEGMAGPGADEVELESVDEALADFQEMAGAIALRVSAVLITHLQPTRRLASGRQHSIQGRQRTRTRPHYSRSATLALGRET